jgi:hypothetical protein
MLWIAYETASIDVCMSDLRRIHVGNCIEVTCTRAIQTDIHNIR